MQFLQVLNTGNKLCYKQKAKYQLSFSDFISYQMR